MENSNSFMKNLIAAASMGVTTNGASCRTTTGSKVYDFFALGGAVRNRSDNDILELFLNALNEDCNLALKCLFYLADVREGQGERRLFRVCYRWLCQYDSNIAAKFIEYIPFYTRWDNVLYACIDTPCESIAFQLIKEQLTKDLQDDTPSLCGKWMPSENASSFNTKSLANKLRIFLNLSHKEYRKMLSYLRNKIKVAERLMSDGRWDEIKFDKLPSKAGLKYSHAFATRNETKDRYQTFLNNKETKVNAKTLYPYEIAERAFRLYNDDSERKYLQKAWDNLPNYFGDREENAIAVVDVSGSMSGRPMAVAVSMGAYLAEKAHGPFANKFITFSANPQLVDFRGNDIVDKFQNCIRADWGQNTNIKAVFDLLLTVAQQESTKKEDVPKRIYIFSDMEFDSALCYEEVSSYNYSRWRTSSNRVISENQMSTLMEDVAKKWAAAGYELPNVIFWNLNSVQNNIPATMNGRFSHISGFSPIMMESVLSGKTGYDLCLEKICSARYEHITLN